MKNGIVKNKDPGPNTLDSGPRTQDPGSRNQVPGPKASRSITQDIESGTPGAIPST